MHLESLAPLAGERAGKPALERLLYTNPTPRRSQLMNGTLDPHALETLIEQLEARLGELAEEEADCRDMLDSSRRMLSRLRGPQLELVRDDPAPLGANLPSRPDYSGFSARQAVRDVLNRAGGGPLAVPEIASRVKSAGYKTDSPNFRTGINTLLIRMEKAREVEKTERGWRLLTTGGQPTND